MKLWEYVEKHISERDAHSETLTLQEARKNLLDKMGLQGWELCSHILYGSTNRFIFKRELPGTWTYPNSTELNKD